MIQELMQKKKNLIDERLKSLLKADRMEHQTLFNAMNYSLLAGGKRIRPSLFLIVLDMLGIDSGSYVDTACALECIHTYSLIHDVSLPCFLSINCQKQPSSPAPPCIFPLIYFQSNSGESDNLKEWIF